MDLTNHSPRGLASLDLQAGGGAKLRCQISRAYEEAGDFERAREALGDLWRRVGERPAVGGLGGGGRPRGGPRAGALAGRVGRQGPNRGGAGRGGELFRARAPPVGG